MLFPTKTMSDSNLSIAQHYHQRTKYAPAVLAANPRSLDWSQQPVPFKVYKLGTEIDLKPHLKERAVPSPEQDSEGQWWQRLSRLLFCSYGLTAAIKTLGEPIYLRAAPSAGGLYPAEIYLLSRGTPLLPAGIYNYQPKAHSLLRFWDSEVWPALQSACFWPQTLENTQLALVVSAVFFRSAWRYEDRAYRRIFLDTGHLLGNLELACAMNDYRPHLISGFLDAAVNDLMYFDSDQEGAIAVLPLADLLDAQQNLPLGQTALPSATQTGYPTIPDGALLAYLHQATQITETPQCALPAKVKAPRKDSTPPAPIEDKYNFPFCQKVTMTSAPILWGESLEDLEKTILRRRSTRAYTGGGISLAQLKALLDFTYHPEHYIDIGLDGVPDYCDLKGIETFIAALDVDELDAGCYYYAPHAQELRQIRFKNFRRELHHLCLGQDLGRDAAAVVFHTADLGQAIATYGDRAYRYLHMDAGHLGQRLNLAAIQLDLGASGIGGFFDDQVNEVLGIPIDEAVLYITTLGQPRTA